MVRGMSAHRVRTCPVYFSTRDNLPGHLAICVNNIIIMCIGLVHDIEIFTRNIYYGIDMKMYTGMDITCLNTSSWGFICDSLRLSHVTSDVTYHCCAA